MKVMWNGRTESRRGRLTMEASTVLAGGYPPAACCLDVLTTRISDKERVCGLGLARIPWIQQNGRMREMGS